MIDMDAARLEFCLESCIPLLLNTRYFAPMVACGERLDTASQRGICESLRASPIS